MDAKEYLKTIEKINAEIENLKEERIRLQFDKYTLGSPSLGEKVQCFTDPDKMAQIAIKTEKLENRIADKMMELMETRMNILNQIHQLRNSDQIKVLYKRYMELKGWKEIAEECGYGERQIHNIHGQGLKEFAAIIERLQ